MGKHLTENEGSGYNRKSIWVELNYPTSKYHGSIFLAEPDNFFSAWWFLDAPELPRRLTYRYERLLHTNERKTRLTAEPKYSSTVKTEFEDFSGHKVEIGDVLFGDGKLIRVKNFRPGICIIECLHPIKNNNKRIYRYRTLKKYLHIEDPTIVLLKI